MKTFLLQIVILSIFVFNTTMMVGCGSLSGNISQSQLTASQMKSVDEAGEGLPTLFINTPISNFSTKETLNSFTFVPPIVFHWDSLGVDGSKYGYMHMLNILLLYSEGNASLYNSMGKAIANTDSLLLCPLFSYTNYIDEEKCALNGFEILPIPIVGVTLYGQIVAKDNKKIHSSRYYFLNLPIIGPCFAVRDGKGTGTSRFLWIPYDGFDE
jgi:hypothetical protein